MSTRNFAEKSTSSLGTTNSKRFVLAVLCLALVAVCPGCAAIGNTAELAATKPDAIKISAALGKALEGTAYDGKISATGANGPYHFLVISGSLPKGLSLQESTGAITGTPATGETTDFTVRVYSAEKSYHADLGLRLTVTSKSSGITVTVSPASATVTSGATQQLSATIHSQIPIQAGGGQVRWSTTAGSITTSGLFTAPTTSNAVTATVSATSLTSPSASGSSTISVTPIGSGALSVATSSLPTATQGSSYSANLAATGGAQPYNWTLSSGTLPNGLSISSTGGISGNPAKIGSFSFTVTVTDAASHHASSSLALAVDTGNSNGKFDGPAELPRIYMQSALANTPANGKSWAVSDSASLQNALNASACGDTIHLAAGTTFSGVYSFPGKACDDQHWIIVRTSAPDSMLPAEGNRITPCFAGVASLPGRPALNCASTQNVMAKLVINQKSGSGPVVFQSGANHYRLIGLEITRRADAAAIGNLAFAAYGTAADHIIFDRVWMHGTAHDDTTRAVYLSGLTYAAVVDSYLNDFHCESKTGTCTDAQTISGGLGDLPGGPYKIVNNFLESSGEIVLFGGGRATVTPADIEVRHNHFFKPLTWMPGKSGTVAGNHGNPFIVKNHFEVKNAQRVLFEGNIAENVWGGFSQSGFSILMTPKNQGTTKGSVCPICQVTDITVRYSTISHAGGGFQIANALSDTKGAPFSGQRYSIHDVILDDISAATYNGQGQLAQISTSPGAPLLSDVQISHVTAFPSHMIFDIGNNTSTPKMPNFVFANSIVNVGAAGVSSTGGGTVNCAYNTRVPANLLSNCFSAYTFSSNALLNPPSRFPASSWPSGNTIMQDGNAIGFVNFNNGNGGDYHLQPGSPCKKAGSDGKDLGADVNAVDIAILGAY